MENNETVSRSELKYLQLIDKLEDNVQILTDKLKESEKVQTDLNERLDKVKKDNIKQKELNTALNDKVNELEKSHEETTCQAKQLDDEVLDCHELIKDVRHDILSDEILLAYLGKKADAVFMEAFQNGTTVLKIDYLKSLDFPLILLVQLDKEEFGLKTSNFKLLRASQTDYKLIKINNAVKNPEIPTQATLSQDNKTSPTPREAGKQL